MIRAQTAKHRCAPRLNVNASVNGIAAETYRNGGRSSDPSDRACDDLEFWPPFEPGTNQLDVSFESNDDPEIASWHIAAEWDHAAKVWTDDDIQLALQTGEPFSVQWSPEEAPEPDVEFLSMPGLLHLDSAPEEIALVALARSGSAALFGSPTSRRCRGACMRDTPRLLSPAAARASSAAASTSAASFASPRSTFRRLREN